MTIEPEIQKLIQSDSEEDRRSAVVALAKSPSMDNFVALKNIAEFDESAEVRYFAKRAMAVLKPALKIENADDREDGRDAKITPPQIDKFLNGQPLSDSEKISVIRHFIDNNLADSLPRLILALKRETAPEVIAAAVIAVGKLGGESEVEIILPYLDHESYRVRANTIEALELIGGVKVYPYVIEKLSDDDNRVRANAAKMLKNIGTINVLRVVRAMAASFRHGFQASAAYALGFFPANENIDMLLGLMKSGDACVRNNAIKTLAKYRDAGIKRAAEIIEQVHTVREASQTMEPGSDSLKADCEKFETLCIETSESVEIKKELSADLKNADAQIRNNSIIVALQKVGHGIGPLLMEQLKVENDEKVIATILHGFGRLGYKPALAVLFENTRHQNARCRASAVEAIGEIGGDDNLKKLTQFLKDENNRVRANAILALAAWRGAGVYTTLLKMAKSREKLMQLSAAYVIIELGEMQYYDLLLELEKSEHEEVVERAAEHLAQLEKSGITIKKHQIQRESKIFRVFVSSTFSDFKQERDRLNAFVFPKLRAFCESEGYKFQAVDLRWGVTDEAGLDQQTMKICLDEIKRCQMISPMPNFIILSGDRYGWRPLPYEIPRDEFEALTSLIKNNTGDELLKEKGIESAAALKLLCEWYSLDENAVPVCYCLKPRETAVTDDMPLEKQKEVLDSENKKWGKIENELQAILRALFSHIPGISTDGKLKYTLSATTQEIVEGALKEKNAKSHVFCFFRKINGLPHDKSAEVFVDLINISGEKVFDEESYGMLQSLRKSLKERLPYTTYEYEAEWTGCGIKYEKKDGDEATTDLDRLCEDVESALKNVILNRIAHDEEIGKLLQEKRAHENFRRERSQVFIGREDILDDIYKYVNGTGQNQPLMIHGISGSGKTSLLAKAIADIEKRTQGGAALPSNTRMIFRFVGATAKSSDIRYLLSGICDEIYDAFNFEQQKKEKLAKLSGGEDASKKREEIEKEYEVTQDMRYLPNIFKGFLNKIPQDQKAIIFIDALDQMQNVENALKMEWLPNDIPANVKIIISTLPNFEDMRFECFDALKTRLVPENILELPKMSADDGYKILNAWLALTKRRLTDEQFETLLDAFEKNPYPLYLKLCFEEACLWKSDLQVGTSLLGRNEKDMIEIIYRRLSRKHGAMLVDRCLGYLAAAKNGLSEDEIIDILSSDEDFFKKFKKSVHWELPKISVGEICSQPESGGGVSHHALKTIEKIPAVVWSRLYFDLAPYLCERDADGTTLFNFYHRHLHAAAKEKYLCCAERIKKHEILAKYFMSKPHKTDKTTNLRKMSELPRHQARGAMFDELTETLTDLWFLSYKCSVGMYYELLDDYEEAMRELPEMQDEIKREEESHLAIEKYTKDLIEYSKQCGNIPLPASPESLTIQTDEEIDKEIERLKNNPDRIDRIKIFMQFIQSEGHNIIKNIDNPAFMFQQAYNGADSGLVAEAAELAVSGINDSPMLLLKHGCRPPYNPKPALLKTLMCQDSYVSAVAITPDGKIAVSLAKESSEIVLGKEENVIRVWDIKSSKCIKKITGHKGHDKTISITPDGLTAVTGSELSWQVWDIAAGMCIKTFNRQKPPIGKGFASFKLHINLGAIAITPDGKTAVSENYEKLRVWDVASGKCLCMFEGHSDDVYSVAITPNGKTVISIGESENSNNQMLVWDIATGMCSKKITCEDTGIVKAVAITPDGKTVLSTCGEHIIVWDIAIGKCLHILEGHTDTRSVAITPNGKIAVSGGSDGALRVWDIKKGKCLRVLEGYTSEIQSVAIAADAKITVSGNSDGTLKIWNITTGNCYKIQEGLTNSIGCVKITSDGKTLISACNDYTIQTRDIVTGKFINKFKGHTDFVNSLKLTQDEKIIISKSNDNILRVTNIATGECLFNIEKCTNFNIAPDGKTLISEGEDWFLHVWDIATGKCLFNIERYNKYYKYSLSPDGKTLVAEGEDCFLHVWKMATRKCLFKIEKCTDFNIAPDGKTMVSKNEDCFLYVWDMATGKCLFKIEKCNKYSLTPDGKKILVETDDNTWHIWDIATGKCLSMLESPSSSNYHIMAFDCETAVWTNSDSLVLKNTNDNHLFFSNILTGKCIKTVEKHLYTIHCVNITLDGKIAISLSSDALIAWNTITGKCLYKMQGVDSFQIMSDWRALLTSNYDKTQHICDIDSGKCLFTMPFSGSVYSFAVKNNILVVGEKTGKVNIFEMRNFKF